MDNKLTNEEAQKIFSLYGIGTPVKFDNKDWVINALGKKYCTLENGAKTGVYYTECKLLLTPLEKISDEDAIEVARILIDEYVEVIDRIEDDKFLLKSSKLDYVLAFEIDGEISVSQRKKKSNFSMPLIEAECHLCNMHVFHAYQYLISKGYDVPQFISIGHKLNGKTCTQLGLAIEKQSI